VHVAFAADRFEARQLADRVGMVVDPDVDQRVLLLVVDQQCGGLLAALVAAGPLAGRERAIRRRGKGVASRPHKAARGLLLMT
jgi:hypothetical protein